MTDDRQSGDQSSSDQQAAPPDLGEFSSRLSKMRKAQAKRDADVPGSGHGLALRVGSDFIAGILVGGLLGWGVDRTFDTSPWGLIICLGLGFATGTHLAIRSARELNERGADGPEN